MRPTVLLAAALAALAAAGCSSPCQDLGDRMCSCVPAGTARDNCKQQIKNQLDAVNPGKATEDVCDCLLGTCNAPDGVYFCEWIVTDPGMQACGLAYPSGPDRTAAPVACYGCPSGEARVCATGGTPCQCCPTAQPTLTCAQDGTCTCG